MKIIKVTSSGQVTLPKKFREKFDTDIFTYEIAGDHFIIIPVRVTKASSQKLPGKKSQATLKDLKKAMFHSKNRNLTNLSDQIDQSIYN